MGNFDIPMFVHDTLPTRSDGHEGLRQKIRYSFEQTPGGGRVVIATAIKRRLRQSMKFYSSKSKSTRRAMQSRFVEAMSPATALARQPYSFGPGFLPEAEPVAAATAAQSPRRQTLRSRRPKDGVFAGLLCASRAKCIERLIGQDIV